MSEASLFFYTYLNYFSENMSFLISKLETRSDKHIYSLKNNVFGETLMIQKSWIVMVMCFEKKFDISMYN